MSTVQHPIADTKKPMSLRCSKHERDLIDQAAQTLGTTRTEFMVRSSCREAQRVLLEQSVFRLDAQRHEEFLEALDRDVDNARLRSLLATPAPWDA